MKDEKLPTLRVRPDQVARRVLVVGDPSRAEQAAHLLENAQELAYFREYRTFGGVYLGKSITISSHGVGGAGANMCFHELFRCNVRYIIRAGTCGALKPEIGDGDLIIGTAAIREDGCSEYLAPLNFPAVADRHVVAALEAAARGQGCVSPHTGIILTQGFFYPGILPISTEMYIQSGVVQGVEMEFATLLVMATLAGAKAGGIFTSDGNLTKEADADKYDPHRAVVDEGKRRMLQVALEALANLPEE